MNHVGIAIVGCGRIARSHLAAVHARPDLAKLVAVVDSNPDVARTLVNSADVDILTSLEQLCDHPGVDAAIICLPNHLHASAAIAALKSGKSVLVEKPMASNATEALAMAKAAKQSGRFLAIAQSQRHFSSMRYIAENLNTYGTLHSVEVSRCISYTGPASEWWTTLTRDEGLLLSLLAPHELDFVQMIMGEEDPETVQCSVIRRQKCWQAEDEAMIILKYPSQRMAQLHLSFNQKTALRRKTLLYGDRIVEIIDEHEIIVDRKLFKRFEPELLRPTEPNIVFNRQFEEFIKGANGLSSLSVDADQGVRLMALIDRVRRVSLNEKLE